jgi:hypothetical protein
MCTENRDAASLKRALNFDSRSIFLPGSRQCGEQA